LPEHPDPDSQKDDDIPNDEEQNIGESQDINYDSENNGDPQSGSEYRSEQNNEKNSYTSTTRNSVDPLINGKGDANEQDELPPWQVENRGWTKEEAQSFVDDVKGLKKESRRI
jgi:hypothetical protein